MIIPAERRIEKKVTEFQPYAGGASEMKQKSAIREFLVAVSMVLVFSCPVYAASFEFNTFESQFNPPSDNQGWWHSLLGHSQNGNYFVGRESIFAIYHNFFTFDLSSLSEPIVAARLEVQRFGSNSLDPDETYELFDVSTDAATLNAFGPANAAIFDDLGTGNSYGAFVLDIGANPADLLSFPLNNTAVNDINAAAGGFFSVGGAVTSAPFFAFDQTLFGSSTSSGIQRLVVETTAVPEPSMWVLLATGLGVMAGIRRRKTRGRTFVERVSRSACVSQS